ncbi:MAG TPA: molybdopterin-guanine dinucleotide biosynthesis protein B [Deltaproteobacteria bacterium]|nr:molybdopterin-guanine dinucleotide biosynthesis protein B [Deltaproteobacteria bacterium]
MNKAENFPPIVCIVGFSGSGKTTVTVGLIAALKLRGLVVGTIKHDVHGFEMDRPGKDSWRHKQAGASTTIISSPSQIGMVRDVNRDHHPLELVPLLNGMDIVLVEGFKRADLPKIEVFRPENGKPPACRNDRNLLAVVSDATLDWRVARYAANDFDGLADFIIRKFKLEPFVDTGWERSAFG